MHECRTQQEREDALQAFKSGANPVLLVTERCARGLDLPSVSVLVFFDLPRQLDDYVHSLHLVRPCRGRRGVAVALLSGGCAYIEGLRELLVEERQMIPAWFEDLCRHPGARSSCDRAGGPPGGREEPDGGAGAAGSRGACARPASSFGRTGRDDGW